MDNLKYILMKYGGEGGKGRIDLPITRNDLATLFAELGYTKGAEIGVERGKYSKVLLDVNPDLILHSIDPWKAYKGYREHVTQEQQDGFFEETWDLLNPLGGIVWRMTSMEASKQIFNETLDFVYIDGNHDFQNSTQDIIEWEKKVRQYGIVSGHDYTTRKSHCVNHVKYVVDAYTQAMGINTWFITAKDRSPSWFWIKE